MRHASSAELAFARHNSDRFLHQRGTFASTNCSDERHVHRENLVTDFDPIFTRTVRI